MKAGLWKGKYASVNHHEYFAEGVQSWFDNDRKNDHDHNHVNTRALLLEYDPRLAALCREVFGDTVIRYTKPATRLRDHLAGYDPSKAPRFTWPDRLDTRAARFARPPRSGTPKPTPRLRREPVSGPNPRELANRPIPGRRCREAASQRCGYCLSPQRLVMGRLEVEHVIPLTRGGTDDDSVDLIVRSSWVRAGVHPPGDRDAVNDHPPHLGREARAGTAISFIRRPASGNVPGCRVIVTLDIEGHSGPAHLRHGYSTWTTPPTKSTPCSARGRDD